jgi:molybdenum cofactor biosynthesis enzyme MoaA
MCYFSDEEYRRKAKGVFSKEEIERIAELLFRRTLQLVIGCGTEPTLFKDYASIVKLAKSYGVPFVGLTSNGMLLNDENISRLVEYGLDELALSVHGVRKETYERFMVNATFERFLAVLEKVDSARKAQNVSNPTLRLNYTVNSENLEELRHFFSVFGKFGIKTLQIRPVMDIGGEFRKLLQTEDIVRYTAVVSELSAECRTRGITLLANKADPSYQTANYDSIILEAVKRYISPEVVWRRDFNWHTESYDQFCKKIGWSNFLLRSILTNKESLAERNGTFSGKYAARYEVSF